MRNDVVSEGNCREDILSNACVKEENYFVAPPGNVPLDTDTKIESEQNFNKTPQYEYDV